MRRVKELEARLARLEEEPELRPTDREEPELQASDKA
jgi:hypothetical protein